MNTSILNFIFKNESESKLNYFINFAKERNLITSLISLLICVASFTSSYFLNGKVFDEFTYDLNVVGFNILSIIALVTILIITVTYEYYVIYNNFKQTLYYFIIYNIKCACISSIIALPFLYYNSFIGYIYATIILPPLILVGIIILPYIIWKFIKLIISFG